ncbi:MAG: hypothetical protein E7301_00125 [Butyrivibrio sp.]|nr:hypothetical protein [Butyrivibrio sp.]
MPTNWGAISPYKPKKQYMSGQPGKKDTIAYCHNIKHRGALSKGMVKQHECIQKNCKFFEKNLEHPYWYGRSCYRENKKREKKVKKYYETQGRDVKEATGTLLTVSSSSINSDFGTMLQFFEEMEVFHSYLFYRDGNMRMKYVGGFYGNDIALDKAREFILEDKGDYLLIAGDKSPLIGYRVESRSKALIEIDLTWGYVYPALAKMVLRDVQLRQATA